MTTCIQSRIAMVARSCMKLESATAARFDRKTAEGLTGAYIKRKRV